MGILINLVSYSSFDLFVRASNAVVYSNFAMAHHHELNQSDYTPYSLEL
jgi:hypothetical protein